MLKNYFAKDRMIILFLGAVVFTAFIPFFFGRIIFESDVTYYYLPAFKFYQDALKKGESFFVAPNVLSGFPLYLSQAGGFYEPVNYLLFKIFSFPAAYHLRIFLNYWLGAVFVFLLLREFKFGRMAAAVAAFAFLTSQDILPSMNMIRSNNFI